MAIKINLESTKIPVEIGDLKFEIDVTDEKYEAFIKNFNAFLTQMESLDEEKSEDIAHLKKLVEKIYDDLLGMGAYEKIYTMMPNISFVASTLVSIVTQLVEEMNKRMEPVAKPKAVKSTVKNTKKK